MCSFFVVSCYSTRGTVEEAADQTGYKHQHQTSNVVSSLVQDCRQSKILELNCTDPRESLLYRSRTASCRDAAACKWRGTGSGRRQNLIWDDTDGRMLIRLFRGPGLLATTSSADAAVRVDSGHAAVHMRVTKGFLFLTGRNNCLLVVDGIESAAGACAAGVCAVCRLRQEYPPWRNVFRGSAYKELTTDRSFCSSTSRYIFFFDGTTYIYREEKSNQICMVPHPSNKPGSYGSDSVELVINLATI